MIHNEHATIDALVLEDQDFYIFLDCDTNVSYLIDDTMRKALEAAGWRYAILIGIVSNETFEETLIANDAAKHRGCIKKDEKGRSIWNCDEAVEFVYDITGYDRTICRIWLDYDWPA